MTVKEIYHSTDIRVRYADTDQMGIANNGVYLTWFEVGRTEILRNSNITYNKIEKMGYYLPVIETGVKYLKPARYDDVITVRTSILNQTTFRVRFGYEMFSQDELLATGFTEHVFTNMNMKPVRAPKQLSKIADLLEKSHNDISEEGIIL